MGIEHGNGLSIRYSSRYKLGCVHLRRVLRFFGGMEVQLEVKGCRMGDSDMVSLLYVALLINTRFPFFILE